MSVAQRSKYKSLSIRARVVFDALFDMAYDFEADDNTCDMLVCEPSRKELADRVGKSQSLIDRGLAELRKAGLVESANHGAMPGRHNCYTVFIPPDYVY